MVKQAGIKLLPTLCVLVCYTHLMGVDSTGHIEVHFLRYSDNCREHFGADLCDPMFSFCLSTPQHASSLSTDDCTYASTGESPDHFRDTNNIDLQHLASIAGLANPWVVPVNVFLETTVMLIIRVRDKDLIKSDNLQTWGIEVTSTIWPSKEQALWEQYIMEKNSFKMHFKIRLYCDANFYTRACHTYCHPDDSNLGHFDCDPVTGDKVCLTGWQGEDCTLDLDECDLGYCGDGACTNLPGSFSCSAGLSYEVELKSEAERPTSISTPDSSSTAVITTTSASEVTLAATLEAPTLNQSITTAFLTPALSINATPSQITDKMTSPVINSSLFLNKMTFKKEPQAYMDTTNTNSTVSPYLFTERIQTSEKEDIGSSVHLWVVIMALAVLFCVAVLLARRCIQRRRKEQDAGRIKESQLSLFNGAHSTSVNRIFAHGTRIKCHPPGHTKLPRPVPTTPVTTTLQGPPTLSVIATYNTVEVEEAAWSPVRQCWKEIKNTQSGETSRVADNVYSELGSEQCSGRTIAAADTPGDAVYYKIQDVTTPSVTKVREENVNDTSVLSSPYERPSQNVYAYAKGGSFIQSVQISGYDLPSAEASTKAEYVDGDDEMVAGLVHRCYSYNNVCLNEQTRGQAHYYINSDCDDAGSK